MAGRPALAPLPSSFSFMTRRPRRRISFLWLCSLLIPSLASPLNSHQVNHTNHSDNPSIAGPSFVSDQDQEAQGTGLMVSWLWGLVWGDDSTVSVVDRTPALNFNARPAAFGPSSDVLGYLIRVEDFSVPCDDQDEDGGRDGDAIEGPWWPGGGSEWDSDTPPGNGTAERRRRKEEEDQAALEWRLEARHGCPRLCVRGKDKPRSSETWMALVMRGGCTFVDKIREAQRFGAKGVVVGGETAEQDGHGDGLVQMFSLGRSFRDRPCATLTGSVAGDSSDIEIPSTYITHDSYGTLSSLIASSNTSIFGLRTVSVGIVTDTSGWEWYSYAFLMYIIFVKFTNTSSIQPFINIPNPPISPFLPYTLHSPRSPRPCSSCGPEGTCSRRRGPEFALESMGRPTNAMGAGEDL